MRFHLHQWVTTDIPFPDTKIIKETPFGTKYEVNASYIQVCAVCGKKETVVWRRDRGWHLK